MVFIIFHFCRKEEEKYLSYNYQPFYVGAEDKDFAFQQVYVF